MSEKYLGESIPKLGFGYMRLPQGPGGFDYPQINKMVDHFLENGFTYFDTAFIYQGSEEAMRETLVKRHPREGYTIASKLNLMFVQTPDMLGDQIKTSLERLGTDYLDFYLLHGLGGQTIARADELGAWDFMKTLKADGKVRHIGLSFHGTPEELDALLEKHPEAEFVQLQLNYLDWESEQVQSRKLYEAARKHNTPITVMEPVKGGQLANEESVFAKEFKKSDPNASAASWALRFVADLDGLITILSGMSAYEQVVDNVKTFKGLAKLTDADKKVIAGAIESINSVPRVPCTSCNYCAPNCPQKIAIPQAINVYNESLVYGGVNRRSYDMLPMIAAGWPPKPDAEKGGLPSDCISCKACEEHCPQHIEIAETMAKLAAVAAK